MKKVVRLTESDLNRIVKRVLNEEEFDDTIGEPEFTVEPHVKMIPREKQIQGLFGKYDEQIPADILRYMRKNPQLVMNRLCRIYGDKFLDYAEKAFMNTYKIKD
jgi:hypothetical protein